MRYTCTIILMAAVLVAACDTGNGGGGGGSGPPTTWDETFGTDGLTTTAFLDGQAQIQAILIDTSDRIYAIGWNLISPDYQLAMARYTADGILDTTFGTNGLVIDDFSGNGFQPTGAVFDQNGKILVVGMTDAVYQGGNPVVARYNLDGTVDTDFATSGFYTLEFSDVLSTTGFSTEYAFSVVARASDNAAYVIGTTNEENASDEYSSFVFQLDTDGAFNGSWGSSGLAITLLGTAGSEDLSYAVALDDAGAGTSNLPVIAGGAYNGTDYDFALSKYDATGVLDSTFGTSGEVITDFGANDYAIAIHTYDDGRILAAGFSGTEDTSTDYDIALARYTSDGTLDTGFGSNGTTIYQYDSGQPLYTVRKNAAIAVDASDRIYFAGPIGTGELTLVRFDANGSIDTSFGNDGESAVTSSTGTIKAIGIQSDGKIVVGGEVGAGSDRDFHLARFDQN